MPREIDPIKEGIEDYRDEMRLDHYLYKDESYNENVRLRFTFETEAVKRGIVLTPKKKWEFAQKYLEFLKKVGKRVVRAARQSDYDDNRAEERVDTHIDLCARMLIDDEQAASEDQPHDRRRDHSYSRLGTYGLPPAGFFKFALIPCVSMLAQNERDADEVFDTALTCLEELMVTHFWASSSQGVSLHFYEVFFHPGDSFEYSWDRPKAKGNFADHYKRFGPKFAVFVAALQGRKEDEHYDGGSYSFSGHELDTCFLQAFEYIPRQYHDSVLDVAINFARHVHNQSIQVFLRKIDTVIDAFKRSGNGKLLQDYFELCRHAVPEMRSSMANRFEKDEFTSPLPFMIDGEAAVEEMKALAKTGRNKEAVLQLACFCLENDRYCPKLTFSGSPDVKEDFWFSPSINFRELLGGLKADGRSPEEINTILRLPERHPWLGDQAIAIIKSYNKHDEKHPGGVAGLIQTLEKLKTGRDAMRRYLASYEEYPREDPGLPVYLNTGERLARELPYDAEWFFSAGYCMKFCERFAADGGARFNRILDVMIGANHVGTDSLRNVFISGGHLKDICTDLYDEPKLDEFLEAIETITNANADKDEWKDFEAVEQYRFGLKMFCSGVLEYWESKESEKPLALKIRDRELKQSSKALGDYLAGGWKMDLRQNDFVLPLIRDGFDPRIALGNEMVRKVQFDRSFRTDLLEYDQLNFLLYMEDDQGAEAVRELAARMLDCRDAIRKVLTENDEYTPLLSAPKSTFTISPRLLTQQLRHLEEAMKNPPCVNAKPLLELRKDMESALQIATFRHAVSGIGKSFFDKPKESGMLSCANDTTRVILTGATLFAALGAFRLPGIDLPPLRQADRIRGLLTAPGGITQKQDGILPELLHDYEDEMRQRTTEILPVIERLIIAARKEAPGMMPEGGKIHAIGTIDPNIVDYVQKLFGLQSTPFRLQHSSRSLLLPPAPTDFELQMLMSVLALFGVMDTYNPDMQLAMGGRLPTKQAAVSAISVLLSTESGAIYKQGTFRTADHDDLTGARIMAYDAGVKISGLPYDRPQAEGRTDMLGRSSLVDAHHYRIVHNLLVDINVGGPFAELGKAYMADFLGLLRNYRLEKQIDATEWIFDPARRGVPKDSVEHHEEVVRELSETLSRASKTVDLGVAGEMHRLIATYYERIKGMREQIIEQDPDEYQRYLAY